MTSAMLLSGLPEDECRRVLGEAAWAIVGASWRDPDALAGGRREDLAGLELVWLYRSPESALLAAPPLSDTGEALEAWAKRNRAGMNLRRLGLSRLLAINVDVATPEDYARALPALADNPVTGRIPAAVADPRLATAIAWLLRWSNPDVAGVFASLEAAAATGRRAGPDDIDPDGDALLPLVDAVRRGVAPGFPAALAAAVAEPVRLESERQRARAEHRALQLQQARDELDQCYAHARKVEQTLAEREADWGEARALREQAERIKLGEEQLLFQLQNVREELEHLHAESQKLLESERTSAAALDAERARLARTEGALESSRAEQARASEEIRALRMQLDFVLQEMRAQDTLPVPYIRPQGALPRLRDGIRRQVLGRIHRRWMPAAAAGAERAAAIRELAASRWFHRDWYLEQYADVGAAGMDPAEHYHDHGWTEGRDPGPDFCTRYYLEAHPDVAASGIVPLLHFIRHGLKEGRLPRAP